MNRRHFLKQFGALAAAGFILPDAAKAAGFQMIIPAPGVASSNTTPSGVSFATIHSLKNGSGQFAYNDMTKGLVSLAPSGNVWTDKPIPSTGKWYLEVVTPTGLGGTGNKYFTLGLIANPANHFGAFNKPNYYNYSLDMPCYGFGFDMDAGTMTLFGLKPAGSVTQITSGYASYFTFPTNQSGLYPFLSIAGAGSGWGQFSLRYNQSDGFQLKNKVAALSSFQDLGLAYA